MARMYNTGGATSDIGANQLQDFYYQRKALEDLKKEEYFLPLASVEGMPKHHGKKIKLYHYIPLLDDRNVNDQGIDAAGALLTATLWYVFIDGALVPDAIVTANSDGFADEATAVAAVAAAVSATTITQTTADTYAITLGTGNLYASSKDVGTIAAKLPPLTEAGGKVNQVGFTRVELEGELDKFGFHDTYTQESIDFDSDPELMMHVNREMLRGAIEMTEDALQIDLLNSATTERFAGAATSKVTVSGESGGVTEISYEDLAALNVDLDDLRCPKETKIISGTRMVDTKTIPASRAMYIGSELQQSFERMTDYHSERAFIPVEKYAAGTTTMRGEIGSVGRFRIIVVPEMMHFASKGAAVSTDAGYRNDGTNYHVYPALVVGSESFTTIGFKTSGGSSKFTIYHKKPGLESADAYNNPFGEKGFMSIKWYYGFLALRAERLAVIYSVART